jgi:hypothetical protein
MVLMIEKGECGVGDCIVGCEKTNIQEITFNFYVVTVIG